MRPLKKDKHPPRTDQTVVVVKTEPEAEPPSKRARPDENGNDAPHPCKLCKEAFGSLDELVMHAKIEHTPRKERMFSPEDIEYFLKVFLKLKRSHCPICRKAILNTLNWRGHLYKHCVTKSASCRVCGKCFTRADHCKSHEARHRTWPAGE